VCRGTLVEKHCLRGSNKVYSRGFKHASRKRVQCGPQTSGKMTFFSVSF
jgi:hypothetical protein